MDQLLYSTFFISRKVVETEIKALIIDDESEICYLLSRILRNRGIESNYVGSLSEARKILTTYVPTIIFLDNHLPDGLGVEFACYLKTTYPDIRIVIITGKESNLSKAFYNGASEIIFKPFTTERIFSVLERFA